MRWGAPGPVGSLTVVPDRRVGIIAGAAAYTLWGLFPLYFPHLRPASPVEVLLHRVVWSFVVVSIVITATNRWSAVHTARQNRRLCARLAVAAFLIAVNWLVYIWAVNNDHVVDAALGYFVNPLVTVLLGVAVLGERLRRMQWMAVAAGVLAVAVLAVGYGKLPWIALVLAGSFAGYGYIKKSVGPGLEAATSLWMETALMLPLALVALAGLGATGRLTFVDHGADHTALLLSAGVVTAVPLLLFAAAARRIPLTMIGLLQYLTPVGQFLVGTLVNHENIPPARLAGFVLVWVALGLLTTDALRSFHTAWTTDSSDLAPAAR